VHRNRSDRSDRHPPLRIHPNELLHWEPC
jgi:hypothetical protein